MAQGPVAAVVMQLSLKYVKASLCYLVAGGTLMLLTFARLLPFEITTFYFMQLYGFVAMMIFGLSYLFVPSFSHAFLYSIKLAKLQFWLLNIGVIDLSISYSGLLPYDFPFLKPVTIGALIINVLALYIHAYNLWRTMRGWKGSPGEKLAESVARTKQ